MFKQSIAIAAAAVLLAGCVSTPSAPSFPNPGAAPTYGSVRVSPGQVQTASIAAGGNINAAVLGGNCRGYIASAPDFVVNFETLAGILPLSFTNTSNGDTTLVIYDPAGTWLCDDDSAGNLNPRVTVRRPVTGRYAVWVGTYSQTGLIPSTLRVD